MIFVCDNGSATLKAGFSDEASSPRVYPNCTARLDRQLRVLVADEIATIRNQSQLTYARPFERGQLTNAGCESEVWEHVFAKEDVDPSETALLVTEPQMTPPTIASAMEELIFEEFQFRAACRLPAPRLAAVAAAVESCVVVDLGASCTTVTPTHRGDALVGSCRRHLIGGKALTGYLRELVSYRQFHMMDETALLEDVKRKVSFVSQDFDADLGLCAENRGNPLRTDYELPEYNSAAPLESRIMEDYADNVLRVESERFAVPEILFSPQDVGLRDHAGLTDLVADAILTCDPILHEPLASNVVLCGGGAHLAGLQARLHLELRQTLPAHLAVDVRTLEDPIFAAFRGAAIAASAVTPSEFLASYCTTKESWLEHGHR